MPCNGFQTTTFDLHGFYIYMTKSISQNSNKQFGNCGFKDVFFIQKSQCGKLYFC